MEDHEGQLLLEDGVNGGARVSLVFPDSVFVSEKFEQSVKERVSKDGA